MTVIASHKDIFVGRIRDLDTGKVAGRVYVDVELREVGGDWQTTDHRTVHGYTKLSITGTEYYANGGPGTYRVSSCGQIINALAEINDLTSAELDLTTLRWLRQVWKRWHLNGLNAGCNHQTLGRTKESCPETGYRHGSAWLVKELPTDLVTELIEVLKLETR
jgi:hypothetical protein